MDVVTLLHIFPSNYALSDAVSYGGCEGCYLGAPSTLTTSGLIVKATTGIAHAPFLPWMAMQNKNGAGGLMVFQQQANQSVENSK